MMQDEGIVMIPEFGDGDEWVVFTLGGTRPWLKGLIIPLGFVYFGLISGDDRWMSLNDKFAEPIRKANHAQHPA